MANITDSLSDEEAIRAVKLFYDVSPKEIWAEIQGFLRGFALAGVRSVVAPATHVDPKAAGDLALAFYREWSGNTTKAEALQRAQQRLRRTHPDPRHWAAHSLVGDYL